LLEYPRRAEAFVHPGLIADDKPTSDARRLPLDEDDDAIHRIAMDLGAGAGHAAIAVAEVAGRVAARESLLGHNPL
jgi:hypothetical protein